jgi:hypothetical protein
MARDLRGAIVSGLLVAKGGSVRWSRMGDDDDDTFPAALLYLLLLIVVVVVGLLLSRSTWTNTCSTVSEVEIGDDDLDRRCVKPKPRAWQRKGLGTLS